MKGGRFDEEDISNFTGAAVFCFWTMECGGCLPIIQTVQNTSVFLGFPCGSAGKESAHNVGDLRLIPGLGRFPGEGKGYPLPCSGLENSMDYSPQGRKELDTTEQLSLSWSGEAVYLFFTLFKIVYVVFCRQGYSIKIHLSEVKKKEMILLSVKREISTGNQD